MRELPEWTNEAGGKAWLDWIDVKIAACDRRAKAWVSKRSWAATPPTREEWRRAIWDAMLTSTGCGHYSRFPLSLLPPGESTDWNWPSLDHSVSPATPELVLEVRLVNDMKTIMNEQELGEMVGHLAAVLGIPSKKLPDTWRCKRAFAIEEPPAEEPPLPEAAA